MFRFQHLCTKGFIFFYGSHDKITYFVWHNFIVNILDEFRRTLEHTEINKFVKFNFDTDFVRLHFGEKRDRQISYSEFTQVLWVSTQYTGYYYLQVV